MLERDLAESVLQTALHSGGDFAEIFVEGRRSQTTSLDDGRIEELVSGRERGAGIRVVKDDMTGFAHTADLSARGLREAAREAAAAARAGEAPGTTTAFRDVQGAHHAIDVDVASVPKAEKVARLRAAEEAARAYSGDVSQVSGWYADSTRRILVANSDGVWAQDTTQRVRLYVQAVAVGDTGMQTGMHAPGYTGGWEFFDRVDPAEVGREAARKAVTLLEAEPAPAGPSTVVLEKGAGGVLFHEACGHGLEADHVQKDQSVFAGKIGERVASPLVTLVDDGGYERGWGTAGIDDEGAPVRRNTLIRDGVLEDYMWDGTRARKDGRELSGNGRRQSYRHLPLARMTNTLLLPGETDPEDIVAGTERGIYVASLAGGSVNTATGDFVFGMSEAYLIEDGEITRPIRGANMMGNGPDVLARIDVIGSDFDTWPGTCGKQGQGVPVTSGQPTLRVTEVTIGGTAT
ncbi:MAG: TldD/PmbA family protein [Acidimicrobiia bacterium]|nr:TldD/PmbA family protein [Acidimicrobiia bacterium]